MQDLYCSVKYEISSSLCDDPENWVTEITGDVICYEEDETEQLVGRARVFYVDADYALDDGYPPEYILDMQSETAPYIEALYDLESGEFNSNVRKILGCESFNPNVVIIDRIEILPGYRGKGLSRKIINETVRLFGARAELVALQSFPLQFESKTYNTPSAWEAKMNLRALGRNEVEACKVLSSHYKSLGFQDLGRDHVMAKMIQ